MEETSTTPPEVSAYRKSSIDEMRSVLRDNPYFEGEQYSSAAVPTREHIRANVLLSRIWNPRRRYYRENSKNFKEASRLSLDSRLDFIEEKIPKLIHPNGIACIGQWSVEHDCGLTGYFAKGSRGLLVCRLSIAAFSPIKSSRTKRGFGIAGKIYPTLDEAEKVETANFVLIKTLIGSDKYFLEIAPSNNLALSNLGRGGTIVEALFKGKFGFTIENGIAFNNIDAPPLYRSVDQIARLGLAPGEKSRTPLYMKVTYVEGARPFARKPDFREELWETLRQNGEITYAVKVSKRIVEDAPDRVALMNKANLQREEKRRLIEWQDLGHITLTEAYLSEGADQRLRFHHERIQR